MIQESQRLMMAPACQHPVIFYLPDDRAHRVESPVYMPSSGALAASILEPMQEPTALTVRQTFCSALGSSCKKMFRCPRSLIVSPGWTSTPRPGQVRRWRLMAELQATLMQGSGPLMMAQ
jgi:hypothetical protein